MQNIFKQGHPKGLYLLFFVEMCERFAFYGVGALVVLYMVQILMYPTQKAGNIYGFYNGLTYLSPIIGGYLADRYLGQRKCLTIGIIFMLVGLFSLSLENSNLFIFSLILIVVSNGFFKSNITSILGLLYGDDDSKKDSGFTIFYMGINTGAFFAPLVCGTLAFRYGFKYGFMAALVGMVIGLLGYKIFEQKYLGDCGKLPITKEIETNEEVGKPITKRQKFRIIALFILMFFTIAFWVCFEQAGTSLTLFAEYATNRKVGNFVIPTEYFQALNPLFIITLAPIISALWGFLRAKKCEPSSVQKFTISLLLMTFAFVGMSIAGWYSASSLVSPLWLLLAYFIMTVGELCLSPIGLSLVSKLAPKKFLSLLMATWYLSNFIGNLIAGAFSGNYGTISNYKFFLILASVSFIFFIMMFLLMPKMNKIMRDV